LAQEKGGWSASCPGSVGKELPVHAGQEAELSPDGVWTLWRTQNLWPSYKWNSQSCSL